MKKSMKKNFYLVIGLFLLILYPLSAGAIPDLIVAPTGTNATYYGVYDSYLDYWAEYFLPETPEYHGFAIPSSGGNLSIAAEFDDISNYPIYLLMDNGGVDYGVSYGGNSLQLITDYAAIDDTTQIDGYTSRPYWGIDIGTIKDANNNPNPGWSEISDSVFSSGSYYEFSAQLTYDSDLRDGLYFFAIVDDNSSSSLDSNDTFSPKTASSGNFAVPEPATMLLFGSGLIGLGVFGRKKFFKRAHS